jgi:hypothetical protein
MADSQQGGLRDRSGGSSGRHGIFAVLLGLNLGERVVRCRVQRLVVSRHDRTRAMLAQLETVVQ